VAGPRDAVEIPHATFDVVPAELGDERVIERIRHRAIVKHWGLAWPRDDGTPIGMESEARSADIRPVLGERGRKIRIVVEDDHARLAVWIARDDAADTALAPIQLADGDGHPSNAWLAPGISLLAKERAGAQRHVEIVDEMLALTGWAPAKAIGTVWVVPAGDTTTIAMKSSDVPTWSPPRDHRPLIRIDHATPIRIAPDPRARTLATVVASELVVSVVATGAAFTEIEASRPFARVRGFIANARILGPTDDFVLHGSGSGHGFGMSHAVRWEIPAGTCFYDQRDGEVVGVALETETRLGAQLTDGWALVYVDTPWNVASMYVRNLETEPGQPPRWDACTEPSHRR
jgi:hypothetical protein